MTNHDVPPLAALDQLQTELAAALADHIGMPLRAVEAAVAEVTADWSVVVSHQTHGEDLHLRYVIHTPWYRVEEEIT